MAVDEASNSAPDSSAPLVSQQTPDSTYDMEANAGREEPPQDEKNLGHEYTIPTAVKFTWLGAYFVLSLLLTIYNKLVLGVVRDNLRAPRTRWHLQNLNIVANICLVSLPMAPHVPPHVGFRPRHAIYDAHGLL